MRPERKHGATIAVADQRTVSSTDGAFELAIESGTRGLLLVEQRGFVTASRELSADWTTDQDLGTIRLLPARRLQVRVTADGRPVAGATVRLIPFRLRRDAEEFLPVTRSTNAEGLAFLPTPGPVTAFVQVSAPGFTETEQRVRLDDSEAPEIEIVLDRGSRVEGVVSAPDGRPIPAATVRFSARRGQRRGPRTSTDGNGAFALDGVPAGRWTVEVDTVDAGRWSGSLVVEPGVTHRLDVEVRNDTLKRRIVTSDGEPISGFGVLVRSSVNHNVLARLRSDPHGVLALRGTALRRDVAIEVDPTSRYVLLVGTFDPVDDEGDIVLAPARELRFRFVGDSAAGVSLEVRSEGRTARPRVLGGEAELLVPAGRAVAYVVLARNGAAQHGTIPPDTGPWTETVRLAEGAVIRGVVRGHRPGEYLTVTSRDGTTRATKIDSSGSFAFGDLAEGTFHLELRSASRDGRHLTLARDLASNSIDLEFDVSK